MFSGMMFCADCQSKMHYCTAKKFTHEQNWFTCALARENKGLCSGHFIREVYVEKAVLESLRRVFWYVQTYEGRFAKEMQDNSLAEKRKALAAKKRELEKTEKRIDELDTLFERTYEDNVSGKITNERFQKLSVKYEAEQAEKKTLADTLRQELQDETLEADGLETFIQMIKKVTMPEELTPELMHQFNSKIVVHEPYRKDKRRHQDIDIHYTGVGVIFSANPKDTERLFQEHVKFKEQRSEA